MDLHVIHESWKWNLSFWVIYDDVFTIVFLFVAGKLDYYVKWSVMERIIGYLNDEIWENQV